MNKIFYLLFSFAMLLSCGKKEKSGDNSTDVPYNAEIGIGKFTKVNLGATIDEKMAAEGEKILVVKCSSCHELTEEKLIGPSWKGITQRRKPEWIMNFITNPEPMIDADPELKKLLKTHIIRMPNQSLTEIEARNILEFMRKNDLDSNIKSEKKMNEY